MLNIPTCLTAGAAKTSDTRPLSSLVLEDFFLSGKIYLKWTNTVIVILGVSVA